MPQDYYPDINVIAEVIENAIGLPGAEALMPFTPKRIPGYIGGSILSQNLATSTDRISKPWQNLVIANNYILSSHNSTHAVHRAAEVALDTLKVNLVAEGGDFMGKFMGPGVAGQMANQAANKYQQRIFTDLNALPPLQRADILAKLSKRFGYDFTGKAARANANTNITKGGNPFNPLGFIEPYKDGLKIKPLLIVKSVATFLVANQNSILIAGGIISIGGILYYCYKRYNPSDYSGKNGCIK